MPSKHDDNIAIPPDSGRVLTGNSHEQYDLPPVVVLIGPTAVGKTKIALQLAERLEGEIVSADSRLFYRGMDVGTAKPTPIERARVPHHLIDVADPDEIWSLAVFQRAAHQTITSIHARERLPMLVGGTGQYVRAVIQGWSVPAVEPNAPLREALQNWAIQVGDQGLHTRLAALDPQAAAQIDYRNLRRTMRALEVIFQTGRRFSEMRQHSGSPYRTLLLGLTRPRPELFALIDARIEAMLAGGLIEEVQTLLKKGYSPHLPTMSAIGYQEISAYLYARISLDEAVVSMKRRTRQFVRRQANWFKESDPNIHWFKVGPETVIVLEKTILAWLNGESS